MKKIAHNAINREGEVHNLWTILEYSHTDNHRKRHYRCKCICGKEKISNIRTILQGKSKSCGCNNIKQKITHNKSNTRVYNIWQNMKNRCLNVNSTQYKWYGARGIKVCQKWVNSFEEFLKDMGEPPTNKHSIDRINNNKGYEPNNCRWATQKEQCNNRRLPTPPNK